MTVNKDDRRCGLYDDIFHINENGDVITKDENMIFLPENAESSKNGQAIVFAGGMRVPMTIRSTRQAAGLARYFRIKQKKSCDEYEKKTKKHYLSNTAKFQELVKDKPKPLVIGVYYMRKTMRAFDYHNVVQHLADLISEPSGAKKKGYGWVKDDDMRETIYVPLGYCVVKHDGVVKDGVIIKVLDFDKYKEFVNG